MPGASDGQILLTRDARGAVRLKFGTQFVTDAPAAPIDLGEFPLAPSVRLEACGPDRIRIRVDAAGAYPLFVAGNPAVVGDSLPEVDVRSNSDGLADFDSITTRILFDCDIGGSTLIRGIRRILPEEAVEIGLRDGSVSIVAAQPAAAAPDPLPSLIHLVSGAFRDGAEMELTGGYDSRLVLALGLAGGARPAAAITFGGPDDFDVQTAKRIAGEFGIPHRVRPFPSPDRIDWTGAERFWHRSGCSVDLLEYAWVPTAFADRPHGTWTQLSGAGGEIAAGFFAFPGDETAFGLVGLDRLVRWRAAKGRSRLAAFGHDADRLLERAIERAKARAGAAGSWREFGLRLYVEERCRSWAGSVLAGSSTLYRPLAPFLTPEYRAVCAAVSRTIRGRSWQEGLLRILEPRLVGIPFGESWPRLRKVFRRSRPHGGGAVRPEIPLHGNERIREAFTLGRLNLAWEPELAASLPGVVVGVGLYFMERSRIHQASMSETVRPADDRRRLA